MNKTPNLFLTGLEKVRIPLLVLSLLYFCYFSLSHANDCSIGFISGYTAAVGLMEGADVADYYNNDLFAERMKGFCPNTYDIFSPNPPTYALMMLPLAVFDFPLAKTIWTLLNLIMMLIICILINRSFPNQGWMNLVLLMLLFQPIYANMRMGQNYLFILLMATMIWVGWKEGKDWMMVTGLVLMTCFKLGLLWVWPLLLFSRKWKVVSTSAVLVVLIGAVTIPVLGMDSWQVFLNDLGQISDKPSGSVTAYQAIPGFFRHMFTYNPIWNPDPLMDHSFLGNGFYKLLTILLLVLLGFTGIASKNVDLKMALAIIFALITSPFTLDYHYSVMIISLVLVFRHVVVRWQYFLFFAAFLLMALPLPYRSDLFRDGIWSFLAYPKLYGATLLAIICINALWPELRDVKWLGQK